MRRDEYLKLHDKDSERIIPRHILPEFKRVLNELGFQTDKLLDEHEDWYVHEYDVPVEKDYPFPSEEDLQLSRDMARRDNAFLEKITKYGEEYCNGYFDMESMRYMNRVSLDNAAKDYLRTFEKYDYAEITPVWEKNENWFSRLFLGEYSLKGYNYHYCQWSVWLKNRVSYFMQRSEALNILFDMKEYFDNYDESERIKNGWKSFDDYAAYWAKDRAIKDKKEPKQFDPEPFDVFQKEWHGFPSSRHITKEQLKFYADFKHATVILIKHSGGFDGFVFFVKGSVLWRHTLLSKEDVREELLKYIERERIQPCLECQTFFRLSDELKDYIIENLVEVIYKEQVDVDYVSESDEVRVKLDEFRQEGAELRGCMHALK